MQLSEFIFRFRWPLLLILLGLGVASVFLLPRLKIEVDFSDFFQEGDSELKFYESYQHRLGSEDNYLSVAIVPEGAIFEQEFLEKVRAFTHECGQLPRVHSASSIATLKKAVRTPLGFIPSPYVHISKPASYPRDSLDIRSDAEFTGRYYFPEAGALAVLIEMQDDLSLREVDTLIHSVQDAMAACQFSETHLWGKRYLEVCYDQLVRKELKSSVLLCLLFIALALALLFRSVPGVLIPLFSMALALILQYGYMAVFKRPLGILANLFPTIVLIVGISDVIHIGTKYEQEIRWNPDRREALLEAIRKIGIAIFLTSFTTAIGFLALRTSSMKGLSDFGMDAAVAVMITFGVSILFVPAVLSAFPSEKVFSNQAFQQEWEKLAGKIYGLVRGRPLMILAATGLLLGLSAWGILHINTNNKLIMSIPKGQQLREDFRFFDEHMGGTRTLEFALEARGQARLNTLEVLGEVEKAHRHLAETPGFHLVLSPTSFYRGMNKIWNPEDTVGSALPESNQEILRQEKRLKKYTGQLRYRLVDSTYTLGRISIRARDPGRRVADSIYLSFAQWANTHIDTSLLHFRPTGTHLMIDRGHAHRISNMFQGLGMALGAVALLMGLLLQNARMILWSLLANLVPLVLAAGAMGLLGIELRGTSSIIFTVGFVIAVDDTIHFLSQYSMRRKSGLERQAAIEGTIRQTGKAIVTTTLILSGGFLILMHSQSWEIYVLGLMMSLILVFALLADLLLIPVLLGLGPDLLAPPAKGASESKKEFL